MDDIFFSARSDRSDSWERDEQLKQLITQIQQQKGFVQNQELLLTQIVDLILRSRPLCYPFNGRPLTGIYQEIYEQAKLQLLHDVSQELKSYSAVKLATSKWVNKLLHQAFKQVLDDDYLKQLGLTAQRYPPQSELRSYALSELVRAIQISGKLCRPHREKFSPKFYQLIYEEAVSETFTYICLKIDKYDPNRGEKKFMSWVNFRLDKMVIECRRKFSHWQEKSLPTINDIEQIKQPEKQLFISELIYQCIEEDTDDIFRKAHVKGNKQANFRAIALARLSGKKWEEIAQELGIVVPTLSSFFQRCCRKFAPILKQKLQS